MKINDFLEDFILFDEKCVLSDEDVFGFKKFLDSCTTVRKEKKTKEEIMSKYGKNCDNDSMFNEMFTELFLDENRPIRKLYFRGDITPAAFDKDSWHDYYETLINWLELENNIEDILSIKYDPKSDLTVIKCYGI